MTGGWLLYKSHLASNAEDSSGMRSIQDVLDVLCFCSNLTFFSSLDSYSNPSRPAAQQMLKSRPVFEPALLANQLVTATVELDDVFYFFSLPPNASSRPSCGER